MKKIKIIKYILLLASLATAYSASAFESSFNLNLNALVVSVCAIMLLVVVYLLTIVHSLKRSHSQLQLSEKRLKSTVEGSGDTLWDWNIKTGKVIRINDKYVMNSNNLVEFPPNKSLIHPRDLTHVDYLLKKHFAEESTFFEATYRIKDSFGKWHWVLDRGKIIEKDANLSPLRMTGTVRDISQLKSTEDRLNLFAKCVESLTDALAIYDKDFRLVDINPSFLTLFGGVREQYLKKEFHLAGYDKSYIESIKNTVRKHEHIQEEVKLRNSDHA
ncbi:MAG: PAS domain S-box protein, partial [Pseudoalteromonas tetraodonis]|nr:PAS domain S-box protein [Pseudoalteromonas tetraodonis]